MNLQQLDIFDNLKKKGFYFREIWKSKKAEKGDRERIDKKLNEKIFSN